MSSNSSTPPDEYFNDLSRQNGTNGNKRPRTNDDAYDGRNGMGAPAETLNGGDTNQIPKPKRIACIICRKRKLKCDGTKPSCSTCTRLNHNCSYDEVRKKSGPKRGYVKALEERLSAFEAFLLLYAHYILLGANPSFNRASRDLVEISRTNWQSSSCRIDVCASNSYRNNGRVRCPKC